MKEEEKVDEKKQALGLPWKLLHGGRIPFGLQILFIIQTPRHTSPRVWSF
jgi:hypothetical protein